MRRLLAPGLLTTTALLGACDSGMQSIDRRTLALLEERTEQINAEVRPEWPRPEIPEGEAGPLFGPDPVDLETRNPSADQMDFSPKRDEAEEIVRRVTTTEQSAMAVVFDLKQSVAYAVANSREYQDAAEAYVLVALQVLIERHLWGPRFFDTITSSVDAVGDNGVFDAALSVVNDFTVRQRLPYGGEVSASLLANAAWDLSRRVSDGDTQSAEVLLQADIPLLRGAGLAAREELIQAERDLIYAAREFERFRRTFVFEIATEYLDLVVGAQAIDNANLQVLALVEAEERELALFRAGRRTGYDVGLAAQSTLFARNTLASQVEAFRLAVDRFKVRLGMPTEQPLTIETDNLGLPTPEVDKNEAVMIALTNRLDLQNERDRFDDARRRVDVAHNNLLPDLNVFGSASVPTDPDKNRGGVDFSPGDSRLRAGVALSLPLDRDIERAQLRQAQLFYEQAGRRYSEQRDTIAVNVRNAVRQIDRALFSVRLQEENIRIARLRNESIAAAPDRANARDRRDAIDDQLRAEDGLAVAKRDLQVAILGYFLATDQLRVDPKGGIIPLKGMTITTGRSATGRDATGRSATEPRAQASGPTDSARQRH